MDLNIKINRTYRINIPNPVLIILGVAIIIVGAIVALVKFL